MSRPIAAAQSTVPRPSGRGARGALDSGMICAVLRAGGLTDRVVALGFDQLVLYGSASAYEAGLYRKTDPADLQRYWAGIHAFYASLPPGRYPVLTSVTPDMTGPD